MQEMLDLLAVMHIGSGHRGAVDKPGLAVGTNMHLHPKVPLIRFRLKELIADKGFKEGRVITMLEVAEATGVHRMTLSKLANHRGYNPTADVLDRLCTFFGCRIEQLVEHIPEVKPS